ncbi:unnamed protein product [marine sediment metagenome]|uniref:Uncharacterized protein n=1 Tax=marine sediment metagenome TaxID=412755 RepID=X1QJE4_9ZZZZ
MAWREQGPNERWLSLGHGPDGGPFEFLRNSHPHSAPPDGDGKGNGKGVGQPLGKLPPSLKLWRTGRAYAKPPPYRRQAVVNRLLKVPNRYDKNVAKQLSRTPTYSGPSRGLSLEGLSPHAAYFKKQQRLESL